MTAMSMLRTGFRGRLTPHEGPRARRHSHETSTEGGGHGHRACRLPIAPLPTLSWKQSAAPAIEIDAAAHAWHAGHVNDVLPLAAKGAPAGLVVASDTGGAWLVSTSGSAVALSDDWDAPDLRCLSLGPGGDRHVYAGGGRSNDMRAPRLVSWGPGRLDLFAVGAGGAVWHRWGTFGAWEGWESLGGEVVGTPAVVTWGPDRLDLFAVGTDGRLFHKAWDGASWRPNGTGWRPLGGDVIGSPTAVSWAPGRLDVFAPHPGGGIRHINGDGESWASWENLGGDVRWSPTAVSWGPERLDVFVVGTDRRLFHKAWDGSDWLPGPTVWRPLGGSVAGTPAAVAWSSGRLDVVAVHPNRSPRHLYGDGTNFSDWESLGGGIVATPAVVARAPERLDIVAVGLEGAVYHKAWDGAGWKPSTDGWAPLKGIVQGDPCAAASAPDRLEVVVVGGDGALYERSWQPAGWKPPDAWRPLGRHVVGALHETDRTAPAPLLKWKERQIPVEAGLVLDIAVAGGAIVLATQNGVWTSVIPPTTVPDAYAWKRAEGLPAGSYSGVVAGPGGSIIAAAEGSNPMTGLYGLFRGEFSLGTLFMTRASISGIDAKKMERTVVAVCDRTPSVLYAACGGAGDRLLAVLRSADGGYSWTACGLSVDGDPKGSTLPDLAGNQSRYNNAIDVSPVDERVVALGWRNGPWISTNRGQTWLPKGMGWSGDSWQFTSPHLHSDVHAVSFDRTDPIGRRLYVATDGGVAFTPDLGETFTSAGNEQLATLQFQSFPARAYVGSLAASGGAANVVAGGLQDNGDVVGAIAAGTPWQQFAGGDGMLVSWLGTGQILYQTNGAVALRSGSWTGTTISGGGVVPINVTKSGGPADLGGLGPPAGDVTLATIVETGRHERRR